VQSMAESQEPSHRDLRLAPYNSAVERQSMEKHLGPASDLNYKEAGRLAGKNSMAEKLLAPCKMPMQARIERQGQFCSNFE
jgi:hypothetical protein